MGHKKSARLALTYAVIAIGWIGLSDGLLMQLGLSAQTVARYSFLKGLGFVAVTGLSLYLLVDRLLRTIERREQDYRDLFELNPNPMWFYDLDTLAFLRVNDAAVAKYGYTAEEFAHMTLADIRPQEDIERLHANVEAVRSGEAHDANESGAWRHVTKDGRVLWVDITSHVAEFDGRPAEAVLVRDLSEAHAAREELFRVRREHKEREDRARWPDPSDAARSVDSA